MLLLVLFGNPERRLKNVERKVRTCNFAGIENIIVCSFESKLKKFSSHLPMEYKTSYIYFKAVYNYFDSLALLVNSLANYIK